MQPGCAHIKGVIWGSFGAGGDRRRVSVDSYSASVKCIKHSYKNYSENKIVNKRKQRKYINNVIVNYEGKNNEPNWIFSSKKDQVNYENLHKILQKE